MPTCAALKCARCYMLYAWPSHSICLHASPNASSCIPTVPTTGTDAHRVIWPSDAWSRAVCGYIVPEKYYEATRWQLYNQQEKKTNKKKPNSVGEKAEVKQKLLQPIFSSFFCCTDGINSCLSHCASSRMCSCWYGGKSLFVGMSASQFKRAVIRRGQQM